MRAKKCDKCGSVYQISDNNTIELKTTNDGRNRTFDLCPQCWAVIDGYLKSNVEEAE